MLKQKVDTRVALSRLENIDNMLEMPRPIALQSDLLSSNTEEGATSRVEMMGAGEENEGDVVDLAAPVNYVMSTPATNAELKDFFSRPVLIHTQAWTIGTSLDPLTHSFYPWELYLTNGAIKSKLDHYGFLRGNLHLKVVVNSSPFYYGMAMLSYAPCHNIEHPPVGATGTTAYNVGYSQRPHIKILPQYNQGGELVVPFFWYFEWLSIKSSAEAQDLGRCRFTSFGDLQTTTTNTTGDISIQVFAWLDDAQITGPTNANAMQAGDEYGEGVVSKPASAIARATGMLSDLPVVGSFFTATSLAAGKMASVARLFGYTNVPVIDDVHSFKNQPLPQLASADIGTSIEKLSLDSKNELSIDPKINTIDSKDELDIVSFVGRESFLADFTWDSTDAVDARLFVANVTPELSRSVLVTGQRLIYDTPMGHLAKMFTYWRGDISFRFIILASQYHRGRLAISWDPVEYGFVNFTTQYTEIVDIGEVTDITIRIPYIQNKAYLETAQNYSENWSNSAEIAGTGINGQLRVEVLNKQTSPLLNAPIRVLVFVKGEDNFEFAAPREIDDRISPYAVQSGVETAAPQPKYVRMGGASTVTDPNINLVYMGENIKSLRTLYRRSTYHARFHKTETYSATKDMIIFRWYISRRPRYPGFDPAGVDTAIGNISTVSEPYNWVSWCPMTWVDQCFVGSRGSVHWHITPIASLDAKVFMVSRTKSQLSLNTYQGIGTNAFSSDATKWAMVRNPQAIGLSGMSATNQTDMSTIAVSVPMYSNYKFLETSPVMRTLGSTATQSNYDSMAITIAFFPEVDGDFKFVGQNHYVAAGTDYTPVFFLNVPTKYYYTSDVVPT